MRIQYPFVYRCFLEIILGPKRGKDVVYQMSVTLEQLYNGAVKKLAINKKANCKKCEGRGTKEQKGPGHCHTCKGEGRVITTKQIAPNIVSQIQTICDKCGGTGEFIDPKDRCKTCDGKKFVREKKILEVHIDKGMEDGQKVTFTGEGDMDHGIEIPGDIIVVLDEQEHPVFKRARSGGDLLVTLEISLTEALCGMRRGIHTLDDRVLIISTLPGEVIKNGALKCIMNEGMPRWKDPYEKGKLIVQFSVKFPDAIDPAIVPHLEKLLPQRDPVEVNEEATEDVTLMDLDYERDSSRRSDRRQYDEDDAHESGVQCAAQ